MSHYKIEGRGKVKAEPVVIGRCTTQYTPEFIPRTTVAYVSTYYFLFDNFLQ